MQNWKRFHTNEVVTPSPETLARSGLTGLISTTKNTNRPWLQRILKPFSAVRDYDWRHVPAPNWRSKRNGIHYW